MSFVNPEFEEKVRQVHGITAAQRRTILAFLQGAVYCWCKNRKEEPFAARDLIGGDNNDWQGTPLMALYEYYLDGNDYNYEYAVSEAGKAAGRLLFDAIANDRREFETWDGFTRMYRWTGN